MSEPTTPEDPTVGSSKSSSELHVAFFERHGENMQMDGAVRRRPFHPLAHDHELLIGGRASIGLPIAPIEADEVIGGGSFHCFNIDAEIDFWMSNIGTLKWSSLETDRYLLVELIKFAYDGYILYGGGRKESSWISLLTKFKASGLSRKISMPHAEIVLAEVWGRVYGESR